MAEDYDVVIIGSGAGGGTLAHRLAPSGQAGADPRARRLAAARDARTGTPRRSSSTTGTSPPTPGTTQTGKSFQPQIHYYVGGATKFYGAALYRLREKDFGELKHHGGVSPAWPVGYDVFEPYYTQAEALYQVHGARGEDPTEPPSTGPYPYPPVSHEPRIQQLFDDLAKVGLHPFHSPSGIMLDEANPAFSACIRCATCDGFPCLVHAKSDADVIAVRPALQNEQRHPGPQRHGAPARDRRHRRARSPPWWPRSTATEQRFTGSIVVVSAGAANSAKLLLASANDKHPNGLANGSDQVGRNYVFHNSRAFLAISTEKNDTRFQKTLGVNDYYFGDADFDFPMGNVQMVGKSSAPMYRGEKPIETGLAPDLRPRRRRRAGRRLLAVGRGPARPGQPGHPRTRTATSGSPTRRTTASRSSSSTTGSRSTSATWACTRIT